MAYRAIIEAARRDACDEAAMSSVQAKHQRLDGSDSWTIVELANCHDNDFRRDVGNTDGGLFALLHSLSTGSTRA